MKLHFKMIGEGRPILILHGLFGSGDNWATFGKKLSQSGYAVYLVDLRNHGHSPWSDQHSYADMAGDVAELIDDYQLKNVIVLGHSMGGKATMQLAITFPKILSAIIVADIAPRYYSQHHQTILKALQTLKLTELHSRGEAEKAISATITDTGTRQFLLKNLFWKAGNQLAWRFNLEVLSKEIESVGEEIKSQNPVDLPALFIKGEKSVYISSDDESEIFKMFPSSELEEVKNAGHWIHADQPDALLDLILRFLNNNGL